MHSNKEKISNRQLATLIVLFTIGSSVLFIPAALTEAAEQDAWISAIVATVVGLFVVLFYAKLHQMYPKKSYFESVTHVLGKWCGGVVIAITYIFFFLLATLLLWDIGDFLKTQILVTTPIEVIFVIFMLTVIYGARIGIESIARAAEIFIPWIIMLFLLMIIFLLGSLERENILPIMEDGIKPILHGSYYLLSFPYLEVLAFLMITPHVNKAGGVRKAFVEGVLIGGCILIISTLFCILVLGADLTARHTYPLYVLGKKVSIGKILERVEVFIAIIWFLSIYFKLSIIFYILITSLKSFFRLKDYRPLTLPMGMLLIVMTIIMYGSTLEVQKFSAMVFDPLSYTVCIIFPIIVYIVSVIRKKTAKD